MEIISEHKRRLKRNGNKPPERGYKRVMAVYKSKGNSITKHIDIKV